MNDPNRKRRDPINKAEAWPQAQSVPVPTGRRQSGKMMQGSEARYRLMVENANEAIYVAQDGFLKFVNPKTSAIIGFPESVLTSRPFVEFIHPDDQKMVLERHVRRMQGERLPSIYPFRIIDRTGQVKWVELNTVLIHWEGRPATLNFLSDITERKRAEEELRESEARFRALFERAGICIMVIDLDGKIREVNAAAQKILGYKRKELCSMVSKKLIHPDDVSLGSNLHKELLKGKRDYYQVDKRYIRKDGQWIWGRLTISLVRDLGGNPHFYIAIIEDITERRRAEEELQKRGAELKIQAQALEEANVALRVVLKRREADQKDLEEKVLSTVKELVLPFMQELKKTQLNPKQRGYLGIVEANLNEIISPFAGKLSAKYLSLTPKEIQVASLVKEGKTSKEIAELLNVSPRAIEFHRNSIRKKVGLKNKKANLRSYLLSLP